MSLEERFGRALERAGALSFSGTGYRFVALRYADPGRALSGEGAARYGGRYNPVGVRAVYLSEDARTAVAETGYGVSLGGGSPPRTGRPGSSSRSSSASSGSSTSGSRRSWPRSAWSPATWWPPGGARPSGGASGP